MPKLYRRTKNLIVRPLESKDFKVWREGKLACDKGRNLWDSGKADEKYVTRRAFNKVLSANKRNRKNDRFYDLKIFDRKTGKTVGGTALMEVARGLTHTCFLGYYLYNNYWGRGWAKEAVLATLDIGFKDLKLHRIEAGIEPGNHRSQSLARALKMRREGVKKRALYLRGQWVDLVMFTLTTEDLRIKFLGKVATKRASS